MADQPVTPPTPAIPHAATALDAAAGPSRTEKVMALLIAVLCGTVGALVAFILFRHLGAGALVAIGSSGATFLGVTGVVKAVEEKLGVL
ncbi:hypothetical protein ABT237_16925 [Streptomyces sp. NPDC001581]|uniref:hypothetical protein n=1 Tax=Streptomyces sp. NPDC001581 TaxID=3154386 RepID=UPI003322FCA3